MVEGVIAGVALIALGLVSAWQFAPELFGVLGSLALAALGAWLALGAAFDRA